MQQLRTFFHRLVVTWESSTAGKLALGCGALAAVMLSCVACLGLIIVVIAAPTETSGRPTTPTVRPTVTLAPTSTPQPSSTPLPATATSTPEPTPTAGPKPDISGILDPWTDDTPVAGRHLTLCKVSEAEGKSSCELMTSSVVTDDEGEFEFLDVPAGTYMVIYDSGVGSFEAGMERWGGTEFRIGDSDWCDRYFGHYADSDWVTVHIPQGADVDPGLIKAYAQFSLGYGDSPFILAHRLGETFKDEPLLLRHITVEVVEGETAQLTLPIAYYGD